MAVEQLSEHPARAGVSVSPCSAGPALVVVIGGEADWTTAGRLHDDLAAALAYGPRSVVLDLTDLTFCDLQGLRALMSVVEKAEQIGVDVTVHGQSQQLRRLTQCYQDGRRAYRQQCRSGASGSPSR